MGTLGLFFGLLGFIASIVPAVCLAWGGYLISRSKTGRGIRALELGSLLCAVGLLGCAFAFALLGSMGDPAAEIAQILFLLAGLVGLVGIPVFLGGFVGFGQRHRALAERVEELEEVAKVLKRRSGAEHTR